jgi:hypothetical protein
VLQEFKRGEGRGGDERDFVPSPEFYVSRAYGVDELLPWGFIDQGIDTGFLLAERRKAFKSLQTPPCDVGTCHACKVC